MNQFNGTFPLLAPNLTVLDLSSNQITGELPNASVLGLQEMYAHVFSQLFVTRILALVNLTALRRRVALVNSATVKQEPVGGRASKYASGTWVALGILKCYSVEFIALTLL